MQFEFATAARILFGVGTRRQIPALAATLGNTPFVVTGKSPARNEWLIRELNGPATFAVPGEPAVDLIRTGVERCRAMRCDVVIGVGGGSVLDSAKAIAALAPNSGEPLDYLEVIGKAQPLASAPLPLIAVPTTAGTGAEVTRNAVLGSPDHGVKASLRSPLMLPRIAVVDPELTIGVPPAITATTGLDAITQLIEPYVSIRANPVTDGFCLQGLPLAAVALRKCFADGADLAARTDMAAASLLGGLALANAGLGVVHGFAAPLGGMFDAPHGALCAALLRHGIAVNIRALRERDPDSQVLLRYRTLARLVSGDPSAPPEALAEWVQQLCRSLHIPRLGSYGIVCSDVPKIVGKAANASSMKSNPIILNRTELAEVLTPAL